MRWRIKTRVLRAQGDLDGAKALIRQLLQVNPLSGFRYFDLGMISIYQGDHKSALSNMQMAKQLAFKADDLAVIDDWIAMMLLATGQYADAIPQARLAAAEMASDFGRISEFPWLTLIAAEALSGQLYDAHNDLNAVPRDTRTGVDQCHSGPPAARVAGRAAVARRAAPRRHVGITENRGNVGLSPRSMVTKDRYRGVARTQAVPKVPPPCASISAT